MNFFTAQKKPYLDKESYIYSNLEREKQEKKGNRQWVTYFGSLEILLNKAY